MNSYAQNPGEAHFQDRRNEGDPPKVFQIAAVAAAGAPPAVTVRAAESGRQADQACSRCRPPRRWTRVASYTTAHSLSQDQILPLPRAGSRALPGSLPQQECQPPLSLATRFLESRSRPLWRRHRLRTSGTRARLRTSW
ncbi:unnamed protein product, partial [Ixodes pacificus]